MRTRGQGAWLATVTACFLVSCGSAAKPPLAPAQLRHANVLLVTIDTLRQDRIGAYGNRAGLTPAIDRLAREGVRFRRAFAHAPMTLPSHASILTGLTPRRHGVRNNTGFRLDDRIPTLATLLKRAGYRTGAFVGAFVLDARFGLARDFDVYDDHLPPGDAPSFRIAERRAGDVVSAAADWLLQPAKQPYFAWVHLFDPHAPYDAPAEYGRGRSAYDAEVAYTDAVLGRFLDRLRSAGLLDRTLVVVTADHGESLGEHGETTHGLFAYQSTIAVPLIVEAPGMTPAVDDTPATHADIVPTVLDLIGASVPPTSDGISLARRHAAERAIYFEAVDAALTRGWAPLQGVVQGDWKYIDLPEPEIYDLASDPSETRNRIADPSHRALLQDALKKIESVGDAPAPVQTADAETSSRLRSLGYIGGAAGRGTVTTAADDPKRLVPLNERFNTALTAFTEGRAAEALDGFRSVLRERPDFLTARTSAAAVLVAQGHAPDAVRLLRDAPASQRRSSDLQAKLGAALREAGDLDGAVRMLEALRQSGPPSIDVDQDLAVAYASLGRLDEARRLLVAVTARDRAPATTWYNLGLVELQAGRRQAAAQAFNNAVEREPAYGEAWQALGAAVLETDRARAIEAWAHAERLRPRDYDLLFNLGVLLADGGDATRARPHLERFIREAPPSRYARDIEQVRHRLAALERGAGR